MTDEPDFQVIIIMNVHIGKFVLARTDIPEPPREKISNDKIEETMFRVHDSANLQNLLSLQKVRMKRVESKVLRFQCYVARETFAPFARVVYRKKVKLNSSSIPIKNNYGILFAQSTEVSQKSRARRVANVMNFFI